MTLMLRDLPDGRVQISLVNPLVIATVRDREVAQAICVFVDADIADYADEDCTGNAQTGVDPAEADALDLTEVGIQVAVISGAELLDLADTKIKAPKAPALRRSRRLGNLPVVAEVPRAPARLAAPKMALSEAQRDAAFMRLGGGEPIALVAQDFGVSQAQLRGAYGHHCKLIQRHLAEGGQQPCSLCQKPFTPSLSHPDTCARCSHG